jgi:hypothetical protein
MHYGFDQTKSRRGWGLRQINACRQINFSEKPHLGLDSIIYLVHGPMEEDKQGEC